MPLILLSLALWSDEARAEEEYVEAHTNEVLDVFFKLCVTDEYRAQLMFDLAADRLWPRLPTKLVESRRPPDAARFEGWIASLPELMKSKFFVYAGDASDTFRGDDVKVEICAMFFGNANAIEFIDGVKDELDGAMREENVSGARQEIIFVAPDNQKLIVTLVVDENTVKGRGIFASTVLIVDDPK